VTTIVQLEPAAVVAVAVAFAFRGTGDVTVRDTAFVGCCVGCGVGATVGCSVGATVGCKVAAGIGAIVGGASEGVAACAAVLGAAIVEVGVALTVATDGVVVLSSAAGATGPGVAEGVADGDFGPTIP
jgi:hypothetical protein